jgi:hypothetical protein
MLEQKGQCPGHGYGYLCFDVRKNTVLLVSKMENKIKD